MLNLKKITIYSSIIASGFINMAEASKLHHVTPTEECQAAFNAFLTTPSDFSFRNYHGGELNKHLENAEGNGPKSPGESYFYAKTAGDVIKLLGRSQCVVSSNGMRGHQQTCQALCNNNIGFHHDADKTTKRVYFSLEKPESERDLSRNGSQYFILNIYPDS
ncbi:MAG: hypothetical protein J0H12_05305 [Candidatus Paracaedimonas acanthamoebae]|uniref:Uncharacterized protein n=1 Tax=Candidatus Paracaedimonas acanthamoebae TaxID=244581 RepID=A0A8J7TTW7_9PROT|nr:hypothetical protein [Candidatus Paracaedimonas acanthamoebae]